MRQVDFDVDRFDANLDQVNPEAEVLEVSALKGEGIDAWRHRLLSVAARA